MSEADIVEDPFHHSRVTIKLCTDTLDRASTPQVSYMGGAPLSHIEREGEQQL